MKRALVLSLALAFSVQATAQTVADPAYSNMQRTIGGIIQQVAKDRGLSVADPRTYGTLYGVGRAAGTTAAGVGAGLLIGGTAPAWASLLAGAAAVWAVGKALDLAYDGALKWATGSDGKITASGSAVPSSGGVPGTSSGQVWGYTYNGLLVTGGDTASVGKPIAMYGDCGQFTCSYSGLSWVDDGVTFGSDDGTKIQYTYAGHFYRASDNMSWPRSAVVYKCKTSTCTFSGTPSYTAPNPAPATGTPKTLDDAVKDLTDAVKAQKVGYDAMATMINDLAQKAAAQPDYQGMAVPQTQPLVTAADVQRYAEANPSTYPTVGDMVAPQTSPQTAFQPAASPSPTVGTAPVTSPTAPTATNPNGTQQGINLGADPQVGAPSLEATPTAQSILQPLLNVFPDLRSFTTPSHSAVCPTPSMTLFSKAIKLEAHCSVLEDVRPTLAAVMAAVWAMVALFIILRA